MIAKTTRFTMPATDMKVGLHRLVIMSIRFARNTKNEQIANNNGEMAIDIKFQNHLHQSIVFRCWLTDKAIWIMDNLRKATGVFKEDQQTPAKEMVGKELYGIIAAEFYFTDEKLARNPDGTLMYKKSLVPKFFQALSDGPTKKGDPAINKGVPAEDFLVNPGIDLRDFITEKDREWFLTEMGGINAEYLDGGLFKQPKQKVNIDITAYDVPYDNLSGGISVQQLNDEF